MRKRFIILTTLLFIIIIVPSAGAEAERFKIYIINEAKQVEDHQKVTIFPHYESPFDKTTVIKLDTQTGDAWMMCSYGKITEGKDKNLYQSYWGWCDVKFPKDITN